MFYFRRQPTINTLTRVLLLGIVLRSLVASGFMLDTQPADGSLLSIRLCDGPAGIYQLNNNDEHHHHAQHEQHQHPEPLAQDHGFSACSFWSSSSQLLLTTVFLPPLAEQDVSINNLIATHGQPRYGHTQTRFPRAPPALV